MSNLDGCQIPCLPRLSSSLVEGEQQSLDKRIKRKLAGLWNYSVKPLMKKCYAYYHTVSTKGKIAQKNQESKLDQPEANLFKSGDLVKVRSCEEIEATLDPWKENNGCAFLEYMWQYCGTTQRILKPLERFLDERDYKVKKVKGLYLLEGVICEGTPVFGRCDRCCFLFWREEWLEKVKEQTI